MAKAKADGKAATTPPSARQQPRIGLDWRYFLFYTMFFVFLGLTAWFAKFSDV